MKVPRIESCRVYIETGHHHSFHQCLLPHNHNGLKWNRRWHCPQCICTQISDMSYCGETGINNNILRFDLKQGIIHYRVEESKILYS